MSGSLTKVITRAGQIATLLSERGFPVSSVSASSSDVVVHLMPEGQKRSAYWALTAAGIEVVGLNHVGPPDHLTEDPFTVATGGYHGLWVRVFGAYEPDRQVSEAGGVGVSTNFRAPDGKLILPVNAPRTKWLRTRLQGVGGTDIATLMGANKYQTIFDAWTSKTTDPVEESTEAMWWGSKTEALTVERFEQETGLLTKRAGTYAHRKHPHHLINPDRFTSDGGVLEVKDHESMSDAGRTVLAGEVTDHAWCQLQWAMHVTGRSHGWFVAKVGKRAVILGPFARNDAAIERMVEKADWFWNLVQTGTPPPIDFDTITAEEVALRFPVVEAEAAVEVESLPLPELVLDDLTRLAELRATGEKAAEERAAIETRLKAAIGDREYLTVQGRPVYRWQQVAGRRTFDKAAAVKALAEAWGKTPTEVEAELTRQGAPSRRFSPVKEKA